MNTNAEYIKDRVVELFKTHCVSVGVAPDAVVIELREGVECLTLAQMNALAGILETERIDFRSFNECTFGGSEWTPASYDSGLRVTARPVP